jgi:hypothetical protein
LQAGVELALRRYANSRATRVEIYNQHSTIGGAAMKLPELILADQYMKERIEERARQAMVAEYRRAQHDAAGPRRRTVLTFRLPRLGSLLPRLSRALRQRPA